MPALTQIKLSAVNFVPNIAAAPRGSLLQIADSDHNPIPVMRAELPTPDGTSAGIVHIENGGLFVDLQSISRQALDLAGLAEIAVEKPAPQSTLPHDLHGGVYQITDGRGIAYQAQAVVQYPGHSIVGFLVLSGPSAGKIINADDRYFLGQLAVVPV